MGAREATVAFLRACVRGEQRVPLPVMEGTGWFSGPADLEGDLSMWRSELDETRARDVADGMLAIWEEGTQEEQDAIGWYGFAIAPDAGARLTQLVRARRDELRARDRMYRAFEDLAAIPETHDLAIEILREEAQRPYADEIDHLARHDLDWLLANLERVVAPDETQKVEWIVQLAGERGAEVLDAFGDTYASAWLLARPAAHVLARWQDHRVVARLLRRRAIGPLPEPREHPDRPRTWEGVVRLAGVDGVEETLRALAEKPDREPPLDRFRFHDERVADVRRALRERRVAEAWSTPRQAAVRALLDSGYGSTLDTLPAGQRAQLPRVVSPPRVTALACPTCGFAGAPQHLRCRACGEPWNRDAWLWQA